MSTRSGRVRQSLMESGSPPQTRKGVSPPRSPARTRKSSPSARSSSRKSPSRKSPTRKSPSRKSPTRKSPSRKPTPKNPISKSPSRPVRDSLSDVQNSPSKKNPISKSPSRPVRDSLSEQNSPSKRPSIKPELTAKFKDVSATLDFYRSTRSRRVEYSSLELQSNKSKNELSITDKINGFESHLTTINDYDLRNRKPLEEVPLRRSSRFQDYVDGVTNTRQSVSKSMSETKSGSKSISKSIEAISDEENSEDDLPRRKSMSVTRRLATPLRSSIAKMVPISNKFEFGGNFGPFILIMLIPLIVFSILISCTKLCLHKTFLDLSLFKSLNLWFNYEALILVAGQYITQAIFLMLPILGIKQENEKGRKQCFNAFFATIFTINILFALDYMKQINVDAIPSLYLSLASISYIFAALLALVLYTKKLTKLDGDSANQYGNTGYFMNDFIVGREIHPYIKKLNVKLWISRISNINALILSILIFKHGFELPTNDLAGLSLDNYKEFISKVRLKPTVLLYSMMQIVYILNFVLKEHKITSTFYWQSEGLGYLQAVSSALYPFCFTSIAKYVLDANFNMSTNTLITALILFVVGFTIMLVSNKIKHEFRENPFQPSVAHLNSMPTFHGNKLLISNLWGVVRHPNYTGDIILHTAFALPGILTYKPIAALPAILTIIVLLHRAWRDHSRCSRRYGAAWQRYCKRVPSVIIPKIL